MFLLPPVFPIYFPYISHIFPIYFPWSSQVFFGVPYGFSPSTPGVEGFRCQSLGADLHLYPRPGSALWFVRSFVRVIWGLRKKRKKQWKYKYTAILSGYVYIYIIYYSQTLKHDFHIKKTIVSHCFSCRFSLKSNHWSSINDEYIYIYFRWI